MVGFELWRKRKWFHYWQHFKLGKNTGDGSLQSKYWGLYFSRSDKPKTANPKRNKGNAKNGELALMSQGKKVVIDMSESIKNGSGRDMEQWILRLAVLYILFGENAMGMI
jgi:hypothetical protein